jgi:uncharacterized membrane protein YbhN (UPF0104 family)
MPHGLTFMRTPLSQMLSRTGWVLYILSLLTPDRRGHDIGARLLLVAPAYGVNFLINGLRSLGQAGSLTSTLIGVALICGFAANLALFVRLNYAGRITAMLLPWPSFVAYCCLWSSGTFSHEAAPWTLFYFYPWALGITLIHTSRLPRISQVNGETSRKLAT